MDFRQYDQALGRFNVMDALSEMAYEQTPYRYGFNNPVFWKDPSGLFETHKQAAKFLSDNGLNGSITYNQDFNGYVVTVQGGEFDGTQFYDFSEVMEDMVIETTSKRGGGGNGNENGTLVSLFQEPGKKVMESKNSFLGKLWFTLEPREWTDEETNLTYQVNADGTIKGIRPLGGLGVLGFVNGGGTLKAVKSIDKSTYLVYKGLDASGDVRYVGITSRAPSVRFSEHLTSGTTKSLLDYRVIDGATGLTRTQARALEQTLINQHGLGKNGGQLLNNINSISPKNWWKYNIK